MKIFGKVISVSDAGDEMKTEGTTTETAADPKESNEKEKQDKPVKGRAIRILKGIGFASFAAICAAVGFKFRGAWDRVSEALGDPAIPENIVDVANDVAETVVEPENVIDVASEAIETAIDTVTEEM